MTDKTVFYVIHETVRESWMRDAGTFALVVGVIGTGWLLGSAAMQWFGFGMVLIFTLFRGAKTVKPMTAEEAMADLKRRIEADLMDAREPVTWAAIIAALILALIAMDPTGLGALTHDAVQMHRPY